MNKAARWVAIAGGVLVAGGGVIVARAAWHIGHPAPEPHPLPAFLIGMATPEGQEILTRTSTKSDYDDITRVFASQQYRTYCGVASAVTALNALGPNDITQDRFFTDQASAIRSRLRVFFSGMTLEHLGRLIESHDAHVEIQFAEDSSLEEFRGAAAKNLAREGDYLLVNYSRPTLEQDGGGHISPVAAYDGVSDRFLIFDTASYKYPPVWVEAGKLFDAMNTKDPESGKSRGWVVVRR